MSNDERRVRRTELIGEATDLVLAATNPWSLGRKVLELVRRAERGAALPGLPEYMLDWINDLARDVHALGERVFVVETDRGRTMVLGNYGEAAWREASDERRRMLGDAALATILADDFSTAEHARIERTIRLLDPEDLLLLRRVQETCMNTSAAYEARVRRDAAGVVVETFRDEQGCLPDVGSACYECLIQGHLEGAVLLASGCVQMMPSQGVSFAPQERIQVTALGRLVLRFLGKDTG